jgi:hypothetical protein
MTFQTSKSNISTILVLCINTTYYLKTYVHIWLNISTQGTLIAIRPFAVICG